MPLPNYGYFNKEEKKHQELVFDMAPEFVDQDDSRTKGFRPNAKESTNLHKKRAQVTTGKLGIDLERKMVIHDEKDPNVWKAPSVDKNELQEAKKYATPERKDFRRQVRSSIDSLISGRKAQEIRDGEPKKKPSELGFYLGSSSSMDNSSTTSPPTTPVRRNFSSMSSDSSSRASPYASSTYSGSSGGGRNSSVGLFGSGNVGLSESPMGGTSSYAQERSSYYVSSSTSAYSSSSSTGNYRKPSSDNMLDDFRRPAEHRIEDLSGGHRRSPNRSGESISSFTQKRSTGIISTERIIPVRRQ